MEVTVADTGIGISAEDQATIFEKFGQLGRVDLHSSGKTKFKGGGPGLGLPIARRTAELHGGTLTLSSPETGGSAFTLRLPIHALSHLDERTA